MDEDAPNIIVVLIFNICFYVVIPLIMLYRRGYFINFGERTEWINNIFNNKNAYLPKDWTIVRIRPISAFEKCQIKKIIVGYKEGPCAIIILKSGKTREFQFIENKGYHIGYEIHKDNILIRTWQKSIYYKYDITPIIEHDELS